MIDAATEQLVFLRDVPKRIPPRKNGQRINLATIYRWCSRGCRGIVLETLDLGGAGKATSVEAMQRFFVKLSRGGQEPAVSPRRTGKQRRRSIERAERSLAAAGA
jgi:hypothetical protein